MREKINTTVKIIFSFIHFGPPVFLVEIVAVSFIGQEGTSYDRYLSVKQFSASTPETASNVVTVKVRPLRWTVCVGGLQGRDMMMERESGVMWDTEPLCYSEEGDFPPSPKGPPEYLNP